MSLIDFGKDHTTVVGLSQEGKTYAVTKSLLAVPQGVLFINTKLDKLDVPGFTEVDHNVTWAQVLRLLQKGRKICFNPSRNKTARSAEVAYMIKMLFNTPLDMYLAIDEVHLFDKKAESAMDELATTGLSKGLKGIWISQRPANISNTQMTQSRNFIFFWTNMESPYLKRYSLPGEEIEAKLKTIEKYGYVTYDFKEVRGPFKV